MKLEKQESVYRASLDVSEYDYLEVTQAGDMRITIKFLDTRWRTVPETIRMLEAIIRELKTLPTNL